MVGDWNVGAGVRNAQIRHIIGKLVLCWRCENGDRLTSFPFFNRLYLTNLQFQKTSDMIFKWRQNSWSNWLRYFCHNKFRLWRTADHITVLRQVTSYAQAICWYVYPHLRLGIHIKATFLRRFSSKKDKLLWQRLNVSYQRTHPPHSTMQKIRLVCCGVN